MTRPAEVQEGFRFHWVEGMIAFDEAVFDVIICNYMFEHVGGRDAQQARVAEITRVLRPGGPAYLAFPNRWEVVEPHYGLVFLSWLPLRWCTSCLRQNRAR